MSNFQAKNPKKQEEIFKKISESWVFASGLFVRALSSEKKWPLPVAATAVVATGAAATEETEMTNQQQVHGWNYNELQNDEIREKTKTKKSKIA